MGLPTKQCTSGSTGTKVTPGKQVCQSGTDFKDYEHVFGRFQ